MADEISFTDINNEVVLFEYLNRHKPIGLHGHFKMALLLRDLNEHFHKPVRAKHVWEHLKTYYDIDELTRLALEADDQLEECDYELPFSVPLKSKETSHSSETEVSDKESESTVDTPSTTSSRKSNKKKEETGHKVKAEPRKRSRTGGDSSTSNKRKR